MIFSRPAKANVGASTTSTFYGLTTYQDIADGDLFAPIVSSPAGTPDGLTVGYVGFLIVLIGFVTGFAFAFAITTGFFAVAVLFLFLSDKSGNFFVLAGPENGVVVFGLLNEARFLLSVLLVNVVMPLPQSLNWPGAVIQLPFISSTPSFFSYVKI